MSLDFLLRNGEHISVFRGAVAKAEMETSRVLH
jgi:hypothetical protein